MLCGNFVGIDKLERLKLLQNDPLGYEFEISIKEPEGEFDVKIYQTWNLSNI